MGEEKLEKLIRKNNILFNLKGEKVRAESIGKPVILRGPIVGYEIINEIDKYYPGNLSILENKQEEANAYCELSRWSSEWTADDCIPSIKVQYYKIMEGTKKNDKNERIRKKYSKR